MCYYYNMKKDKVIIILGQTATGKSDLAVEIALRLKSKQAKKYNGLNQSKKFVARTLQSKILGEIISADSRQVYKGLNLGTGKITLKEMKNVPHYLLNIASPKKVFTVFDYQKLTFLKIKEILNQGHVPILCGGTGFYIDAITKNLIFPEVKENKKLRKILNKKNSEELFKILKKLDKKRAQDIKNKNEINNKVRLIRAIEIAKALGKVPKIKKEKSKYQFIKIGLSLPNEILKEKIEKRLKNRIKQGMLQEVKNLHQKGLSWSRMEALGLEYRYLALYLQKKITKKEMLIKLNQAIYQYAKRQKTYFKKDKEIIWLNPLEKKLPDSVLQALSNI